MSSPTQMMSAKRVDPEDGVAYTYEELATHYKGKFKKKAIDAYWNHVCRETKSAKVAKKPVAVSSQEKETDATESQDTQTDSSQSVSSPEMDAIEPEESASTPRKKEAPAPALASSSSPEVDATEPEESASTPRKKEVPAPALASFTSPEKDAKPEPADVQQTVEIKTKLVDPFLVDTESFSNERVSSKTGFYAATEEVEVYYIEVKEGVMHIVGKIENRMVYLKGKACEFVGPSVVKISEARAAAKAQIDQASGAVTGKLQKVKEFVGPSVVKINEAVAAAQVQIDQASGAVTGKLQNGYVYITTTVEGHVVCVKAKTCELVDAVHGKTLQTRSHALKSVSDYTAPMTSKVVALGESSKEKALQTYDTAASLAHGYTLPVRTKAASLHESSRTQMVALLDASKATAESSKTQMVALLDASKVKAESSKTHMVALLDASKAKAELAVQPLKPFYVKAQNGVAVIVATGSNTYVVVQVKFGEAYTMVRARSVSSITGVASAIEGYASPLTSRIVVLRSAIATKIEYVDISFKNGVIHSQDMFGKRIALLQVQVSEAVGAIILMALSGTKNTQNLVGQSPQMVSDLVQKIVSVTAAQYDSARGALKMLGIKSKDGYMYAACQVNDKVFVIRVKIAEALSLAKSKSIHLSNEALNAGKTKALQALEIAKAKTSAITVAASTTGHAGKTKALQALEIAKAKTSEITVAASSKGRILAANPKARVTAASAAGGAAALGATGGAAGLVAGGAVGVACAVPAAFFTFGLSIPVGLMLGAGTGLCVGTAAGGTAGFVSGGAAGYGAHSVHENKGAITSKAKAYKDIALASSHKLTARVMAVASPATAA